MTDAGESAELLHDYGELPGLIWLVPHVKLPTTWGFVLVDELGKGETDEGLVIGYIVGAADTPTFEQYAAEHWWPVQAAKYDPSTISKAKPNEMRCINLLRDMYTAPIAFASARMHINILKHYQGKGWGRKLVGCAVECLGKPSVKGGGVWLGYDRASSTRK